MTDPVNLTKRYGMSEHGNFAIADTIGVPHPYCISSKLVGWVADHFGGMLGGAAIENAEQNGIYCDTCKGQLKFADHKQALLVSCKIELTIGEGDEKTACPELHAYLLKCKPLAIEDNYEGFAFVRVADAPGVPENDDAD